MSRKKKRPIKRIVREVPIPIANCGNNEDVFKDLLRWYVNTHYTMELADLLKSNMHENLFRELCDNISGIVREIEARDGPNISIEDASLRQRIQDKMRGSNGS